MYRSLADLDADGRMDCKEFSIAMHLIKHALLGGELPATLPPSLRIDPPKILTGSSHVGLLPAFPLAGGAFPAIARPPGLTLCEQIFWLVEEAD